MVTIATEARKRCSMRQVLRERFGIERSFLEEIAARSTEKLPKIKGQLERMSDLKRQTSALDCAV